MSIDRMEHSKNHTEYFHTTKNHVLRTEELRTCGEWEHLSHQSVLSRLHVFDILSSFTRTKSISTSITTSRSFKYQNLATIPALSAILSTSCFFRLWWRDSPQWVSYKRYLYATCQSTDRISLSSLSNLTALQMCQSNKKYRLSIHRLLITIINVVRNELFQSKQVNRQTFVVDLFDIGRNQMSKNTFTLRKPDMSHCCGSSFLPLTNIELSSRVNDSSSSSQSKFDSIG